MLGLGFLRSAALAHAATNLGSAALLLFLSHSVQRQNRLAGFCRLCRLLLAAVPSLSSENTHVGVVFFRLLSGFCHFVSRGRRRRRSKIPLACSLSWRCLWAGTPTCSHSDAGVCRRGSAHFHRRFRGRWLISLSQERVGLSADAAPTTPPPAIARLNLIAVRIMIAAGHCILECARTDLH